MRTVAGIKLKWQGALLNDGRQRILRVLCNERTLILDDFSGAEVQPGWVEFVHAVLDTRLTEHRPTLITRAADGAEIERVYGKAVRSRLASLPWIQLPNVDRRRAQST